MDGPIVIVFNKMISKLSSVVNVDRLDSTIKNSDLLQSATKSFRTCQNLNLELFMKGQAVF